MTEGDKVVIEVTRRELEILIRATGSAAPSFETELDQYKLYHKLLYKLNEFK